MKEIIKEALGMEETIQKNLRKRKSRKAEKWKGELEMENGELERRKGERWNVNRELEMEKGELKMGKGELERRKGER